MCTCIPQYMCVCMYACMQGWMYMCVCCLRYISSISVYPRHVRTVASSESSVRAAIKLLSPTHFTSSKPFGRSKLRPDWLAQRKPKLEHTGARTPKDPRSRRSTDNKANLISPSRLYLGLCCCYMFVYIYIQYTNSTVFVL